nr:PREDICTED: endoplasmic reticulum-Golgi intermediate compartment protein 3 [Bemisia tabaci]
MQWQSNGVLSYFNKLKKFDAFSKPLEDFQEKTIYGGAVTIACWVIIFWLVLLECIEYSRNSTVEEIFVDTSRDSKLQINLDIVVPSISCDYLALDAVDSSGEQHLQIDHNISKRRLDLSGKPIAEPQKENVGGKSIQKLYSKVNVSKTEDSSNETAVDTKDKCGSCYGAGFAGQCCNTCEEVKEAYRKRSWAISDLSTIEQCKHDKKSNKSKNAFNEGCQIFGFMEVNRVSGGFHIAPGESFSINHVHVHDVQPFSSSSFNTTHRIRHLSFGQKVDGVPGSTTNPLDGTENIAEKGSTMFQNYIKIVPTLYQRSDGSLFYTNQFSVTKHVKVISQYSGESGMPGIFFSYELSPLMVKISDESKSLGHLCTEICCIISGVYFTFMLMDTLLYRSSKVFVKMEIGKAH